MYVSVCMIVKNEEKMLPRCLDSIKWVDELIVVDTGSEDNTVEIAESYGAKVYHHEWENDFSLHRNQSIGYATGDWILIIDADERFVSEIDKESFKKRLSLIPSMVTALTMHIKETGQNRLETTWMGLRFFRRDSGIKYKGIVHNKASFDGYAGGTDLIMEHYGYSISPEHMEKKRERTEGLLLKRLEENENDFNALYYMVQMNVGKKDWDASEKYGLRFFECFPLKSPENFQFYSIMYFYMSWIYLNKSDGEKSYAWAKKGLELFPNDLDLNYIMARIGWMSKRKDIMESAAEKYFELLPSARRDNLEKSDSFINPVYQEDWANRTVYTSDPAMEEHVRELVEAF